MSPHLNVPAARWSRLALIGLLSGAMLGAPSTRAAVPQAAIQFLTESGYGSRAASDRLADFGFIEETYVVSGNAQKYQASGKWSSDGKWGASVVSNANPYTTAMIVRRPADPAKFNGVVVVEWPNVSTGYPLDVDWTMTHEAILRDGYAYVGLNAQKVGVEGVQKLKQYGNLYAPGSIPDDKLSFDILSQVGKAVRDQSGVFLGNLRPRTVLATGHSQSAGALVTYANAIQPLEKVFDGILIHGRASQGLKLNASDPLPPLSTALRSDTQVPIFMIQAELDVTAFGSTSKQIDTPMLRHWEVAGTSHADQYMLDQIGEVSGKEVGWTPPTCTSAYNQAPFYMAQIAALHHLKEWVVAGKVPPVAPRMARDALGLIKKDTHGNAIGGVRLPELEVPVAKYGISNTTRGSLAFLDLFACTAGGSTTPFAASKLASLYPSSADYVKKYTAAADNALAKGYILAPERDNAVKRVQVKGLPK